MSDTVLACPECDSPRVAIGSVGGVRSGNDGTQYRCNDCKHRFETPTERARDPGSSGGGTSATTKALIDADPEAWP